MDIKLENEQLVVSVAKSGAELISIKGKKDNVEYLWTADPKYWGRHAPVLFPIIGRVNNNKYRVNHQHFELGQHGFARDCDFDLIENKEDSVTYKLTSSDESLKKYPFKFELYIQYSLSGNNLQVKYKVKNTDNGMIYFSIGAHPGFNCPLLEGEKFEDYYLQFNKSENARRHLLHKDSMLYTGKSESVLENSSIIKLTKDLFDQDAIIFDNMESTEVALKNNKNNKKITVNFEGFPYLGIWSKPDASNLICIEPWFGHADPVDFNGDFSEKPAVMNLKAGKEFKCSFRIIIDQD